MISFRTGEHFSLKMEFFRFTRAYLMETGVNKFIYLFIYILFIIYLLLLIIIINF